VENEVNLSTLSGLLEPEGWLKVHPFDFAQGKL